jgi:hypothetical protein
VGLFKKKERPVITQLTCPAEGCSFTCNDHLSLKRHVEWRHPELAKSDVKVAEKVK